MRVLAALGYGAFLLASCVVGVRLLLLWRRTGQLPELTIGLGFLGCGGVGYPALMIAAGAFFEMPPDAARWTASLGLLAFHLGSAALWLAIWRIFQPQAAWAESLFVLATTLLAVVFVRDVLIDGRPIPPADGAWYWVGLFARCACLLWGSIESFRYHARLRRRLALGLTDALTVSQFLLWGIGAGAGFGMVINTVLMRLHPAYQVSSPGLALSTLLGLVAAACIWLTFFPPAALRRRLDPALGGA